MDPRAVRAHIRYLRAVTRPDAEYFAGLMLRWTWPAGHADRFDPVAAEWLRRWRPEVVGPDAVGCGCDAGRCTLCN